MERKTLSQLRMSLRMTQKDIADEFGVDVSLWSRYENGKLRVPKMLLRSIDFYLQCHEVNRPPSPVNLDSPAIKQQMKRRVALSGCESEAYQGLCTENQYLQWKNKSEFHSKEWARHIESAITEHAMIGLLIDPNIKVDIIQQMREKVARGEASVAELLKLFDWLPSSASSPFFLPTPRAMPSGKKESL